MQMTPTISWVQGFAKADWLEAVAGGDAIRSPPSVQELRGDLPSADDRAAPVIVLCITYVVYHAKSIPSGHEPLGHGDSPARWPVNLLISGVWYTINNASGQASRRPAEEVH